MSGDRKNSIIVGVLFILATVTAIIGLTLYGPILDDPDFLTKGSEYRDRVVLGALFELLTICTVIGTAIMLYPYFKRQNERMTLGYLCFRFLEAVVISVGTIGLLSLASLSEEWPGSGVTEASALQVSGVLFTPIYRWTSIIGPNFLLGINSFMCGFLWYKTNLVPRFIAFWGIVGAILIFVASLLEMFDVIIPFSPAMGLFALPVATYEMVLAVWLIAQGFNLSSDET